MLSFLNVISFLIFLAFLFLFVFIYIILLFLLFIYGLVDPWIMVFCYSSWLPTFSLFCLLSLSLSPILSWISSYFIMYSFIFLDFKVFLSMLTCFHLFCFYKTPLVHYFTSQFSLLCTVLPKYFFQYDNCRTLNFRF